MSDEIETMTCDWCGKEFPSDARACVVTELDLVFVTESGNLVPAQIDMDEDALKLLREEMDIDDEDFRLLMETGRVEGVGSIICLECQDETDVEES